MISIFDFERLKKIILEKRDAEMKDEEMTLETFFEKTKIHKQKVYEFFSNHRNDFEKFGFRRIGKKIIICSELEARIAIKAFSLIQRFAKKTKTNKKILLEKLRAMNETEEFVIKSLEYYNQAVRQCD